MKINYSSLGILLINIFAWVVIWKHGFPTHPGWIAIYGVLVHSIMGMLPAIVEPGK
jgi:hypothetical protein